MYKKFLAIFSLNALLLSGCTLHLPGVVKSSVSEKGAHSTRAIRTPVGIYFTSVSFVPGRQADQITPLQDSVACATETTAVRVFYTVVSTTQTARDACKTILDAIAYTSKFGKISQRIEYQASLIPNGEEREVKKVSIYPFSRIEPRFLFFDTSRIKPTIVSIFAHEYIHMFLDLTQEHHEVTDREESIAYIAGVCAQLKVLGSVSLEDLPGAPINDRTSDAVVRSSNQGYAVRQYIYPYLSNGGLDAKSTLGKKFLKECDDRLQDFFEDFRNLN